MFRESDYAQYFGTNLPVEAISHPDGLMHHPIGRLLTRESEIGRGINVEFPWWMHRSLETGGSFIWAANYPSVEQTMRAVLTAATYLKREELGFLAIGRREAVTNAEEIYQLAGIESLILPVDINPDTGTYSMDLKDSLIVARHLQSPGNIFGLTITGNTNKNGLGREDLRTGAARLCLKTLRPLVPMAIETVDGLASAARFGNPLPLPIPELVAGSSDFLTDYTVLAMAEIASLLPIPQRGSFANAEVEAEAMKLKLADYLQ